MSVRIPFTGALPQGAGGAVEIIRVLTAAGFEGLLAGGCVRDLLLGHKPHDYDVATDASADQVSALFRGTRHVGAQFGVVLVKKRRRWIEVATFRADGEYRDGRRPVSITPTDAEHDALRRDFTVNGMFLDPLGMEIRDYVGGRADLAARVIRAIGTPAARFDEDYLRLLRAVRFSARLGFPIEPVTRAAIQSHAPLLTHVAAERVREELDKMLSHPTRLAAWACLHDHGLLPHLWAGAAWTAEQYERTAALLGRLPAEAPFELALAITLADRDDAEVQRAARELTLSNQQAHATRWLIEHQCDLDEPGHPTLAEFKRLMAGPAFGALAMWARARYLDLPAAAERESALERRIAGIAPDKVQPPPLITGTDLLQRGQKPGPAFKTILDALYTQQLDEALTSRADAEAALEALLAQQRVDDDSAEM